MSCVDYFTFSDLSVCVIAPVLNEEKHVAAFLDSLVAQTLQPDEIVFVDGYSKDRTLDIIRSYPDLNIKIVQDATRNIGYIRNIGANSTNCALMIHTNSDAYLKPDTIEIVRSTFCFDKHLACMTGRTYSFGSGYGSKIAYGAFDILRYVFSKLPYPFKKFSPSGNFIAIRSKIFDAINGFPLVRINEDGIFGDSLTSYCKHHDMRMDFSMSLWTGHNAKRFNQGTLKTLIFYSYVFGNFSKALRKLFESRENKSAKVFANR